MSDKIKIDKTYGGNSGSDLKGCYFLATTADCYDFNDTNNNVLAPNICTTTSPLSFSFNNFKGSNWTLSNVTISADTASGDWSNSVQEEVGTWEAGTGEDEAAAAGR